MKSYLFIIILFFSLNVNAQLNIPQLSSSATLTQAIGITNVTIDYSRPSARGRKVFGAEGLLPYNEFWRTGANAATKIELSDEVTINGQKLGKGNYTILSLPGENEWQLNWYAYEKRDWNSYVDKEPLLRLKLPANKTAAYMETFEIHFQNVTLESATLFLEWENTSLAIQMTVDEKEKIVKGIDAKLAGPSSFDYYQAALYYHETDTDLDIALKYIQEVTKSELALFFQVTREALILKDLGMKTQALAVAKRGLELSAKAENKDFVRINEKIIEELGI